MSRSSDSGPITRPTWVFDNPQTILHATPSVGVVI
jgi:hypothetical protein